MTPLHLRARLFAIAASRRKPALGNDEPSPSDLLTARIRRIEVVVWDFDSDDPAEQLEVVFDGRQILPIAVVRRLRLAADELEKAAGLRLADPLRSPESGEAA